MTARMVVMMTPDDKRALEERARRFDMSPSELMRRASQNFDPATESEVLTAFVDQWAANNQKMHEDLGAALDRLDAKFAEIDALRARR